MRAVGVEPGTGSYPAPALPGLWISVWKLLRLRVIIFISGFRRAKLGRKIGTVVIGLLILAFLAFVFIMSFLLLRFLRSPELVAMAGDKVILLESIPVLLVGGAFLGILLTSFGVLLQALYLAGDMDFLLATPAPMRAVFLSKLLQAILPNFGLICLFVLPVLFGLGAAAGYNLLYFPLVPVVLAALALAAAGISSLLVMLVVRIFPARRVAEVLGFVGATASFLCSQSGNLARFENVSAGQTEQALQVVAGLNSPWSPLAWAGRGLVNLGAGRWGAGLLFLALSLGLAGAVFGTALTMSERLYYSGWAGMQGNRRKKAVTRPPARAASTAGRLNRLAARVIPVQIRAVIWKDGLVLRRDIRNLSQLVTPLIFGIVYSVMFLRNGGQISAGRGEAPIWFMAVLQNLSLYANVGLSLFVGWMLLARLAGMGFSQEGRSYWLLKMAPVSAGQLLIAKFLVAFLPAILLSSAFLLALTLVQGAGVTPLFFTLPILALVTAGMTGVNLAFGVTGANMDWEDPRKMQKGTSGCLGSLVTFLYLPFSLGLFFGPSILAAYLHWPDWTGRLAGLLLGGIFSLVCTVIPPLLARPRVLRLSEA